MFETIGFPELFVILVIVLLLFGAKRLPEVASSLGRAITEFKRAIHGEDDKADALKRTVQRH